MGHLDLKEIPRRALWYWAGVPSLVAAGLAVVVTLQFMGGSGSGGFRPGMVPKRRRAGGLAANQPLRRRVEEVSQEVPGEVKVLADAARRCGKFGGRRCGSTQWEDAKDHATYSVTEQPMEKVDYACACNRFNWWREPWRSRAGRA